VTPTAVVQDWGIYLDSDVIPRLTDCLTLLPYSGAVRRSLPQSVFQSLVAALVLVKCYNGRYRRSSYRPRSSSGGHEL